MTISVIICTRNRHDKLLRCLQSLSFVERIGFCEVVVVDQSDQALDATILNFLKVEQLQYLWAKAQGVTKARNQGVRKAYGEIIAFTDDDCIVTPNWIVNAERAFSDNPTALGIFGRVLAYGEKTEGVVHKQRVTAFGQTTRATKPDLLVCNAVFDRDGTFMFSQPCLPFENLGSGNNMFIRREVFERYGMFVEQLGIGSWLHSAEDTEFHYRLLRAGCTLLYDSNILVYHDNWVNPEQNVRLQDGYTSGLVATWVYYGIHGDYLAWKFLLYRWQSVNKKIAEYIRGKSLLGCSKICFDRWKAFGKGIVGGILLTIQLSLRRNSGNTNWRD
ncbi:hypothetical protein BROC_01721 [Candidatus Brocadiaceae bacterium]|nr:hypothetical protein BROC_01721 [Candidatus Brocadiaceae bacterium]